MLEVLNAAMIADLAIHATASAPGQSTSNTELVNKK
jgi:hypothetical protein